LSSTGGKRKGGFKAVAKSSPKTPRNSKRSPQRFYPSNGGKYFSGLERGALVKGGGGGNNQLRGEKRRRTSVEGTQFKRGPRCQKPRGAPSKMRGGATLERGKSRSWGGKVRKKMCAVPSRRRQKGRAQEAPLNKRKTDKLTGKEEKENFR